jgi:hypothetical protein
MLVLLRESNLKAKKSVNRLTCLGKINIVLAEEYLEYPHYVGEGFYHVSNFNYLYFFSFG